MYFVLVFFPLILFFATTNKKVALQVKNMKYT